MTNHRMRNQEAFSLVELVIYIAIMGLIMAVAIPGYIAVQRWAEIRTAKSSLQMIKNAITTYRSQVRTYPKALIELIKPPADGRLKSRWGGPYLDMEEEPVDPWANPYHYQVTPGGKHPFELYSDGNPDSPAKLDAWAAE